MINIGVLINEKKISSLLYSDDIALIAENETKLQMLLNVFHSWCYKWRMKININYRNKRLNKTDHNFVLVEKTLETLSQYKYLGLVLDEHLDFSTRAHILSKFGGRALGSLLYKFRKAKGLGFKTYKKLFERGTVPILDYAAAVWGANKYENIDAIQNRAMRYYLGVHRYASNIAINGDVGWFTSYNRKNRNVAILESFRAYE